ncbi:MaoC family dehydratase [Nocardia huaxiensis]|uniref:MaoC family dehydratase n=1 Tax=Nocardia huaxiensis TaxID=2755382 RepID=A0A7D6ZN93_9NOCA|nr:MaoC family dehydratase [Nocardia huaxiensis]QLY31463.1 MaoC family dehydratase [Nocardia huaxiensis]UFS95013.1 MaoC family dehydratase [Nocardia huaxiensis]
MTATIEPAAVTVGTVLPELAIHADTTFVVSTALATRDFQDVHHDPDKAVQRGSKTIFVNILTDTGLVQRYVTDWAGPKAIVKSISLRLGVPLYAGDTLTLSGTVAAVDGEDITIDVVGKDSLGAHITAKAVISLQEARS